MPPFEARCAKARFLFIVLALALARDAAAQADARDVLIDELRRRIEALEKKLEEKPAAAPAAAPKPTASEEAGREDEGARALEHTLVREGGLVLPKGAMEVEPRLQYTYRGAQGLRIVSAGGVAQVAQQDLRRNEFEASVGIRLGLPAAFQAELRIPYVWVEENRATSSTLSESQRASGLGDVELGLAKQLLAGRGAGMDLLGSLVWKSTTGETEPAGLSPGSGFPQLQAALTAVKRQDPLVFFGAVSYSRIFERQRDGSDVDPGDAFGIKAGALLAASPDTSLRAAFDLSRFGRTQVAGTDIPGSDATVAVLELGLATLLTRRTLLDVNLGIGVTPDAPDFRLRLAVPIRF